MPKRKYTHIKVLEEEILVMRESGKTRQEIADHFGLSKEQTVNLVLDTIRMAWKQEKKRGAAELQLHSDQGFQYTSQGYFNL
ncbi:MAG: hypothetical protein Q4D42_13450 [Eubacteriales bacterium]|nr:hypothetical protein [Eubacteriales bacterium]